MAITASTTSIPQMHEVQCKMDRPRVEWLDALKGLLTILVVIGHFLLPVREERESMEVVFTLIYLFHMPLFVFISGLFSKSILRNGTSLRVDKILSYFFLAVIFNLLLRLSNGDGISIPSLLDMPSAPWYLASLASWYLLLPFFNQLGPVRGMAVAIIISIVGSLQDEATSYLAFSRTIHFLPYFMLGYYLDIRDVEMLRSGRMRIVCILAGVFAVTAYLAFRDQLGFVVDYAYGHVANSDRFLVGLVKLGITSSFGIIMSCACVAAIPSRSKSLSYFGLRSLPIYIGHRLIRGPLNAAGMYDEILSFPSVCPLMLFLLISMVCCLVFSLSIFGSMVQSVLAIKWVKPGGNS